MVDVVAIERHVQHGNGIAAVKLGPLYAFVRPSNPLAPIPGAYAYLSAFLTTDDKSASTKANTYGKPLWYGRFDRTTTLPGDYMIGQAGTFFIAAQQSLLTTLLVECNRVITVRTTTASVAGAAGFGAQPYADNTERFNGVIAMAGWPASILAGTKGKSNESQLPGDVRTPWVAVLVPAYPGVTIRTGDQLTDDLARTFTISSAELTDLGWRLTAEYAGT